MSTAASRRGPAVESDGSLESASVSMFRSARARRYAVMVVALIIVVWAVRFITAPIPQM
jgi:t-SNARE complex subunit (syntaxin)